MHHVCRNSDYVSGIQNLYELPFFLIVTNPDAVEKGVKSITMNGRQVRKLPVLPVGTVCDVEVVMG